MCQAVRLCESWHDAFACKQAYSRIHHTIPQRHLRPTYKKEKPCPRAEKP